MIGRVGGSIAVVAALMSSAMAQRELRPHPPPEKFSNRPVQPPQVTPQWTRGASGMLYSPWIRYCGKGRRNRAGELQDGDAKPVCVTLAEARRGGGEFLVRVAVFEPAGNERKLLRVSLSPNLRRWERVSMFLDGEPPRSADAARCYGGDCLVDFAVNADFVAKLKTGRHLRLEATTEPGEVASYTLPLGDFAKANEGPAHDVK